MSALLTTGCVFYIVCVIVTFSRCVCTVGKQDSVLTGMQALRPYSTFAGTVVGVVRFVLVHIASLSSVRSDCSVINLTPTPKQPSASVALPTDPLSLADVFSITVATCHISPSNEKRFGHHFVIHVMSADCFGPFKLN